MNRKSLYANFLFAASTAKINPLQFTVGTLRTFFVPSASQNLLI
jgi:hypothetical protein